MGRFDCIDNKLADFAKKVNTELSDGRKFHRKEVDMYEERRICWTETEINRMVLISPFPFDATSDKAGSTWNFINVAWLNNSSSTSVPMWEKFLVYMGDLDLIITHIDELLRKSEETLTNVKLTDLKKVSLDEGSENRACRNEPIRAFVEFTAYNIGFVQYGLLKKFWTNYL